MKETAEPIADATRTTKDAKRTTHDAEKPTTAMSVIVFGFCVSCVCYLNPPISHCWRVLPTGSDSVSPFLPFLPSGCLIPDPVLDSASDRIRPHSPDAAYRGGDVGDSKVGDGIRFLRFMGLFLNFLHEARQIQ